MGPRPPLSIWRAEEGEEARLRLVAMVAGDVVLWLPVVGAAMDPLVPHALEDSSTLEDSSSDTPIQKGVPNAKSAARLGTRQIGAGTGLMRTMSLNRDKLLLQPPPTTYI
jgi:hypothetical protein